MRKRTVLAVISTLFIASPVFALTPLDTQGLVAQLQVQVQALLAQIAALQGESTGTPQCVDLLRNFGPDDTDADTNGEVSKLQNLLASQGLLNGSFPKGYFGLATMKALQQWQKQKGIISSGDPDTTGYGFVGRKTRTALACEGVTPPRDAVSVSILSPNAEGYYYYDQPLTVVWQQIGSVPKYSKACVMLRKEDTQNYFAFPSGDGHCVDIAGQEPVRRVSGMVIRTPGYDLVPGPYRAVVRLLGPSADGKDGLLLAEDQSDFYFKIVETRSQNSITVTAPNGGEQWEIGTLNTVTWSPYSYTPTAVNPASDVHVLLESLDGTIVGRIMDQGKASLHTYFNIDSYTKWAQPGQYYVRVINTKTGKDDRSDAPFALLPRSVDLKVNGSDGPVMASHNQKVTVSWTGTGVKYCALYNVQRSVGGTDANISNLQPSGTLELYFAPPPGASNNVWISCERSDGTTRSDVVAIHGNGERAATVEIVSPNGGEQINLTAEKISPVHYRYSGVQSVSVALYKNDQWVKWIAKDEPANTDGMNAISWWVSVGDIASQDLGKSIFKMYITGQKADGTGYVDDKSNAPFAFIAATSSTALKSFPTVALLPLPGTGLADGRLLRFSITAHPSGSVQLGRLSFNLSCNGISLSALSLRAYTSSDFSAPVAMRPNGLIAEMPGGCVQSTFNIAPTPPVDTSAPVQVPAGGTYYFELRGSLSALSGNASATTTLLGDGTAPTPTLNSLGSLAGNFGWSPNTLRTSGYMESDWTNGYGIPGLSAGGVVQIRTASDTASKNAEPVGRLDSVSRSAFTGWACDPDDYEMPISVHFYADGPTGKGTFLGSAVADQPREAAVGSRCGKNSRHGFSVSVSSLAPEAQKLIKNGKYRTIYAYAINHPAGKNPELSGSPKKISEREASVEDIAHTANALSALEAALRSLQALLSP